MKPIKIAVLVTLIGMFYTPIHAAQLTTTPIIASGVNVTVAANTIHEFGPYPLYPYPNGFIGYSISITSGTPNFTQTSAYLTYQVADDSSTGSFTINNPVWNSPYFLGSNSQAAYNLMQFTTTAGVSVTPFNGSIQAVPSNYIKFQIQNNGAVAVTATNFIMVNY